MSQISRVRIDICCYSCQALGQIVSRCSTARKAEGKTKDELVCNSADFNTLEFIYSKTVIALRYISACIDTCSEITLVCRSFLPKGTRLVSMATMITGINENRVASGEVCVTVIRTDCGCFEI